MRAPADEIRDHSEIPTGTVEEWKAAARDHLNVRRFVRIPPASAALCSLRGGPRI